MEYEGIVELTAGRAATIDSIQLSGDGWEILSLEPAGAEDLASHERLAVRYRAKPANADTDLNISFNYNGVPYTKQFNIGPIRMARLGKASPANRVDGLPIVQPGQVDPNPAGDGSVAVGQALHIVGRFVYTRSDGLVLGADNILFEIMDEDTIFDETMYTGLTDENGNFDVTFEWDDCDITGCDDPDIYVRFETDTGVVTVQADSILEENYSWSTADDRWDDFTGNFIDFGTISPADSGQHAAVHIHNSITKAWKYVLIVDGTSVEQVDVQWPETDSTGAFYNPDFEEIHISSAEQWTEGTHTHEFGHHYLENYSVNPSPEYCNNFCDTDVSEEECGHCLFCRETDHDAWNEGWPNWLGSRVNQSYINDYGITPLSLNDFRYMVESTQNCQQDGMAHDPLITEGYAAALLTDMTDTNQDDQDGDGVLDCDRDAMTINPAEIFAVTRLDQPSSPLAFINAFRARFPQHDQDFWSTTRNVALPFGFPLNTPIITSPPQSCSTARVGQPHSITVTGNGSLLKYQWRRYGINLSDGGNVSGTQTPTISFNVLEEYNEGDYTVKVSTCDDTLSVISPPINLRVFPAGGGGTAGISWGRNAFGALGQGAFSPEHGAPNPIVDVDNFKFIAPGAWHTVALRGDGTVWAWGANAYGELGDGTNVDRASPVQVVGLADIVAVAAGGDASLALRADGKVFGWGSDYYGQLGLPNSFYHYVPVEVPGIDCVTDISVGGFHSMLIKSDGTVWTVGNNVEGELGLGYFGGYTDMFQQVPGILDAIEGHAYYLHSMVRRSGGTLLAWGQNNLGRLGDGTTTDRNSPVPVLGIDSVASLGGAGGHSLAVKTDGTVWGWGSNSYGTLGVFGIFQSTVPIQIPGLTNVVTAGGTYYASSFLRSDGSVWVCGGNYSGGLGTLFGIGSNYVVYTPFRIESILGATGLYVGAQHVTVTAPAAGPAVVQQPANQVRLAGQSVTFGAAATGTPQLGYQWLFNGMALADGGPVSGATTNALTVQAVGQANAGPYAVQVTNTYGQTQSATATLLISASAGDANADGAIDQADFALFVACFGAPGLPPNPLGAGITAATCAAIFDGEIDGDVDFRNFAGFQNVFEP